MASRLQQFATRDQKQGIKPKARKPLDHRENAPSSISRQEPTVSDTDVESIGNATTLSFADFNDHVGYGDSESFPEDVDATVRENVFEQRKIPYSRPTVPYIPSQRQPARPTKQADTRTRLGQHDETIGHESYDYADEANSHRLARLDDASSLPGSSRASSSVREPSPSPQPQDPDKTPRRKSRPVKDLEYPSEEPKRNDDRPQLSPQPSTKIQPIFRESGTKHSLDVQIDDRLLDYSPDTLESMPYAKLADEPFESDPSQAEPSVSHYSTILERIRAITDEEAEDDNAKHAKLCSLFAQLPLEQYEAAGDVIFEQFGAVFGRFQDIRRRKRAAGADFEHQVAERETVVRGRHEALDRSASWLKKQGQDVIRGGPSLEE